MLDKISLIDVKTDDTTDYKDTSLLLVFPTCKGKCEGCQNWKLFNVKSKQYSLRSIIELYKNMKTHKAIVCAGLEPFDSFFGLKVLFKEIIKLDKITDFVIYTGYNKEELTYSVKELLQTFKKYNINTENKLIIKYGRYDKNKSEKWYSYSLGVDLATNNQYVITYTAKTGILHATLESYNKKEQLF